MRKDSISLSHFSEENALLMLQNSANPHLQKRKTLKFCKRSRKIEQNYKVQGSI